MKSLISTIAIIFISLLMGCSFGLFVNPSSAGFDKSIFFDNCSHKLTPMHPFLPGTFNGKTNTTLVFLYTESRSIGGLSKRISYNSLTKQLVSSSTLNPIPTFKMVTGPELYCLEGNIEVNGFFEAKDEYLPTKGAKDYTTYSLAIILGNKTHAVTWD